MNTIMIIESRLCAPADVKRGIDVRLRFDLRRHQGSKPESAAVGCPVSRCASPPSRRCFHRQSVGVFVKRNFLGAGKSYMIKGQQAEKKAENALCGRLKCVLVAGNIKTPAHLVKEAAAGVNTPYSHAFLRCKGCILFLV